MFCAPGRRTARAGRRNVGDFYYRSRAHTRPGPRGRVLKARVPYSGRARIPTLACSKIEGADAKSPRSAYLTVFMPGTGTLFGS